jgi:hypothetical protein
VKIEGSASGSISQRHGSADPDPDPHQNVMDPQHCLQVVVHTPSEVKTIALAQADTQVSLLTFFR